MGKTIAIVQSAYIPWKGYFDIIASVDEFILFDDVQFVKRHWHNRNKVKTPQGLSWLTIPVNSKSRYHQTIDETLISTEWAEKHWRTLRANYSRSPCFGHFGPKIEALYREAASMPNLSAVNELFLKALCNVLDISTPIVRSSEYSASGRKTERLLSLCQQAGADLYLSGPSAKEYFDHDLFATADIDVGWLDYSGYPEYPQLHGTFEHGVTVLDLLFNTGKNAIDYLQRPLRQSS